MVVSMEKYAWRGKIVPGMQEEYKKRHDNIWPEMKEVLANAGIVNYSIWMQGEELFGYYECEKGVEYAAKVQAESDVVKKWDEYMKDILKLEVIPIRETAKKHWRRQTVLKRNGRNITLMQVFLSETIKLQVFRLLCPDLNR